MSVNSQAALARLGYTANRPSRIGDTEANELRLHAADVIDALWRHKHRGQLTILQIQLERAFEAMDERAKGNAPKHGTRTRKEREWMGAGVKPL